MSVLFHNSPVEITSFTKNGMYTANITQNKNIQQIQNSFLGNQKWNPYSSKPEMKQQGIYVQDMQSINQANKIKLTQCTLYYLNEKTKLTASCWGCTILNSCRSVSSKFTSHSSFDDFSEVTFVNCSRSPAMLLSRSVIVCSLTICLLVMPREMGLRFFDKLLGHLPRRHSIVSEVGRVLPEIKIQEIIMWLAFI